VTKSLKASRIGSSITAAKEGFTSFKAGGWNRQRNTQLHVPAVVSVFIGTKTASMSEVPPMDWYVCEECGIEIAPEEATTETYPGHREIVTVAFCGDCYE